ncbi:30S ribosomal protein S8 [Rickettsiales bacterium]|jgi:small subunit ribosomal protein S8|nr:30S ribosomal protein S8 [Rickettsiales bacterium]
MSVNHSVSDLVARLRNGYLSKKPVIKISYSKLQEGILEILKNEGFILGFAKIEEGTKKHFNVSLSFINNRAAINEISVISKPGKRIYSTYNDIPVINNGLGMVILSSSKGIITDYQARDQKIGGELLIKIF